MLGAADAGIFFRAPENIAQQFPQFPRTTTYAELGAGIREATATFGN
jgi:phosphoserine/homoserine phosphotransferase